MRQYRKNTPGFQNEIRAIATQISEWFAPLVDKSEPVTLSGLAGLVYNGQKGTFALAVEGGTVTFTDFGHGVGIRWTKNPEQTIKGKPYVDYTFEIHIEDGIGLSEHAQKMIQNLLGLGYKPF